MQLADVTLNDKFDLEKQWVLLNGTQAITRAMLMQTARDRKAGFITAGFVSGYRGSPLGGLDQQFLRAKDILDRNDITFQPGLNEDLAATSIWGAQQAEIRGEGRFDGVFGVWYGKGPGVDRSGDVFRHANLAGTSKRGGVLALMGDDHTCESSTTAHQSEFALVDAMMPILNPAGVQELLDYASIGWAVSRYAGVWVGLKCVKDTIESTSVVDGRPDRVTINAPDDFDLPEGGLNIRVSDPPLAQESRLHNFKLDAVRAFARANTLDQTVFAGGKAPKIGIVSAGKSYLDVRQALDELDIDEVAAAKLGLALYKVAMVWPLEPEGLKAFASGLDMIIVVEEKRGLIETQVKDILYSQKDRPVIIGKKDETEAMLFPAHGALNPNDIALQIARRLFKGSAGRNYSNRLQQLEALEASAEGLKSAATRQPYFCAGCPHNSSTVLPEGARGYAGIGCHWMVQFLDRNTEGYTHMGGEGANWIGEAPHSTRAHIFQNLGDGTYNHSGSLAIRAAAAAGINITFKILFNDAVAMTGGQTHEGGLDVPAIAGQVLAEGANKLAIVSDEPEKYRDISVPKVAEIRHRDDLNALQSEFETVPGVSVIIYDQTCAAEKRRRRKRGTFPDPDKRVFINPLVCEGCGDCSVKSNCLAIVPDDTVFGRKRQIDQSSCNKDFSCLKGFCPSFVTVHGAQLKSPMQSTASPKNTADALLAGLPEPETFQLAKPFSGVIAGIGGTGVVTIAAVLGMAAHLESKACGIIDMAGLSQKGGAVLSHIKIAETPEDIQAIRVAAGGADFILGCDLVVTGSAGVLAMMDPDKTNAAINDQETMPADFTRNPDYQLPARRLRQNISKRLKPASGQLVEATALARALTGDAIGANLLLLGYACQKGYLPVSAEAIERAIRINGVAVDNNIAAFRWGRRAAHDLKSVRTQAFPPTHSVSPQTLETLDEMVEFYVRELTAYQNAAYAERFRSLVDHVRNHVEGFGSKGDKFARAIAQSYFKLLAYKDEYEVARLYTDGRFKQALAEQFESHSRLAFHLAPPVLGRKDAATGVALKKDFGSWMLPLFGVMARFKFLRGTIFDPFGHTAERKLERRLISDFEALTAQILSHIGAENLDAATELAGLAQKIRGFGHVKSASIDDVAAQQVQLLEKLQTRRESKKAIA